MVSVDASFFERQLHMSGLCDGLETYIWVQHLNLTVPPHFSIIQFSFNKTLNIYDIITSRDIS